jgi:hypothetical protein
VAHAAILSVKSIPFLEDIRVVRRIAMRLFLENFIAACLLLIVLLKLARAHPPRSRQSFTDDLVN